MTMIDRLCTARAPKERIAERRERLYKVAFAWCFDRHLADDLVQETLTRAMGKRHQLRDPARLDSWLYSILNNCWREHLRRRRPETEIDEERLECTGCPERLNQARELARCVLDLVARLPEGQRQVLSLVALEGLSYREVADALDIPIGTVMSRLCRARRSVSDGFDALHEPLESPRPLLRRVK